MIGRYQPSGVETEYEPGSRGRVLKNLLGIRSVREMQQVESDALLDAADRIFARVSEDERFTAADVCAMHRDWLGSIYAWAGEYRQVNITKDGFPFAAANLVPRLMMDFEAGPLRQHTPFRNPSDRFDEIPLGLATVHAELILIHPFREGNGRCARLLASLMSLQLGLPPLDFGGVQGRKKREYIAAVHAALGQDYQPMKRVFSGVINRTLRAYGDQGRSWSSLS
jgi:cell filamentation protein